MLLSMAHFSLFIFDCSCVAFKTFERYTDLVCKTNPKIQCRYERNALYKQYSTAAVFYLVLLQRDRIDLRGYPRNFVDSGSHTCQVKIVSAFLPNRKQPRAVAYLIHHITQCQQTLLFMCAVRNRNYSLSARIARSLPHLAPAIATAFCNQYIVFAAQVIGI